MLGESLFSGFARHTACTRVRSNGKTLTCKPGLEDTVGEIQSAGLDSAAPDRLASPNTDVDNALKSERETTCGLLVEGF